MLELAEIPLRDWMLTYIGGKNEEAYIYRFNDASGMKKETVLEAFDSAIKNAKEQENGTSSGQDSGSAGEGAGRAE